MFHRKKTPLKGIIAKDGIQEHLKGLLPIVGPLIYLCPLKDFLSLKRLLKALLFISWFLRDILYKEGVWRVFCLMKGFERCSWFRRAFAGSLTYRWLLDVSLFTEVLLKDVLSIERPLKAVLFLSRLLKDIWPYKDIWKVSCLTKASWNVYVQRRPFEEFSENSSILGG